MATTFQKLDSAVVRKRLTTVFRKLRKSGYFCRHRWTCCLGCGTAALPAGTKKYVFYHRQDAEHLAAGHSLYLAWGGPLDPILSELRAAGLRVSHDGNAGTRIAVVGVEPEPA